MSSLFSYSALWAQESGKVNVVSGQISLKNLIQEIEKQTDYTFVFDNSIPLSLVVSIKGGSENIQVLLRQALGKSDIKYEIVSKQIILRKDPEKSERQITGTVKDEHGEAVIGASVKVKTQRRPAPAGRSTGEGTRAGAASAARSGAGQRTRNVTTERITSGQIRTGRNGRYDQRRSQGTGAARRNDPINSGRSVTINSNMTDENGDDYEELF
ncbi:MAG TPA: carboxypeptidase-like regulatory domain-containing protein [Candidatus Bacteroides intestinigallinarum]|nr:carboxypeptidase-like regulatory domain-containing protein [Candidatus Bacteroides intestinigallinarum]